jgi:hypothetical protein
LFELNMRTVLILGTLLVLGALLTWLILQNDSSRGAEPTKRAFANFYYNNSGVAKALELDACKQRVNEGVYVSLEQCMADSGGGWQWAQLLKQRSCVAKIQTTLQFDLARCGADRGGVGEIDRSYECLERYCSPLDMSKWSQLRAPYSANSLQEAVSKCSKIGAQNLCVDECEWIEGLPEPTLYPKCVSEYSGCARSIDTRASDPGVQTQCCYDQQCMCSCRWMTNDANGRYNCPCYNERRARSVYNSLEGAAEDNINGCGFNVLRLNKNGSDDLDRFSFFGQGFEWLWAFGERASSPFTGFLGPYINEYAQIAAAQLPPGPTPPLAITSN